MKKIIGIIPARFSSQRLFAKPLIEIGGIPMVIRVWKNIKSSKFLTDLIVATDDQRIANVCKRFECPYIMTNPNLQSGTERIFEAYSKNFASNINDIIVNIQGDEPFITNIEIDFLLNEFI